MASIDRRPISAKSPGFDEAGRPWLEDGARMDQKTFHARYEKTPPGFKAELIGGVVYVMASPLFLPHARIDSDVTGWLFTYRAATPGTIVQSNATTILGDHSEPQPDSALLISPEYGGQTRDGVREVEDQATYGAPELVVEVADSSRSVDLRGKLKDYEKACVREYIVFDLQHLHAHWFRLENGRFVPLVSDGDGLFRSRVFPGLWLDPEPMFRGEIGLILAALNRGLQSPEHAAFVAELDRRRVAKERGDV